MLCPKCGQDDHEVTKTIKEQPNNKIKRYRLCHACDHQWPTVEAVLVNPNPQTLPKQEQKPAI